MSSVRLTNDMREILVRRLLTHRYKDAIQAIIDRRRNALEAEERGG
jgi:hypothetical protein